MTNNRQTKDANKDCQKSEKMTLFHLSLCVMILMIFIQLNVVMCKKCNEICGNVDDRGKKESLKTLF